MAPSPNDKSSELARRFLVVTLGIVAFIAIAFLIWRIQIHFRVRSQLAAIRQAGFPTSGAELNNYLPQIPDSNNGALALNAAFAGLRDFQGNRSNNFASIIDLKPSDSWSADARALVQQYLQTNHAPLQQTELVLDRYQQFRFPVDYSFGASAELPHLRSIKTAAQAFRLQTILRAESKDPAWTDAVLSQLKLARALDAEPHFIGYLVRSAILKIASSSAQAALRSSAPDPAVCRLLHDAFMAAAATNTLTSALISERALYAPYFRMSLADAQALSRETTDDESADSPPVRQPTGAGFSPGWMAGFFERDLLFFLSTMEKGIFISRLPAPKNLELTNTFDVSQITRRRWYIFSGMFLPSLSKAGIHTAKTEAAAKIAAVAFAIESFRLSNGRLPQGLEQLVPDHMPQIPTDPFDGNLIRYRQLSNGYVIYSVDVDHIDDGGKPGPERRKPKDPNHDMTFMVTRHEP